ncbi:TPA: porin [Mannheimia haemolytica]|nr:porin [Mannheimia haemolytica]HDZ6723699.1 porin [Mannheimia haemolytica]
MKKTLVALAVTAFAASASATTVYDAEGSKVDFDGSLRIVLDRTNSKELDNHNVVKTKKDAHTGIRNTGSRFGVRVKHDLAQDFYALGRVEFRFNKNTSDDGFGDLYTKRAYVGLGSKQYGELTFGRQVTIANDLSQSVDYNYGINPKGDYIQTDGNQVIRYNYRGVENLHVSANYNFAQDRKDGKVLANKLQNAYGIGALYTVDNWDLRAAYGHTNYKTATDSTKHRKDGVLGSVGYKFGDLKLSVDTGYSREKGLAVTDDNGVTTFYNGVKSNAFYVSPNFEYQVVPASKVYGNYLYERVKSKSNGSTYAAGKEKTHGFLLGVDYQFHKQVVAFVEGSYTRTKDYDKVTNGYEYSGKSTNKAIGVGMRVYW